MEIESWVFAWRFVWSYGTFASAFDIDLLLVVETWSDPFIMCTFFSYRYHPIWQYFYAILFLVYLVVLVWYGVLMKMYEDESIQLQSWIWGTLYADGRMYYWVFCIFFFTSILILRLFPLSFDQLYSNRSSTGTISIGTLELFFRTGDLFVWNEDGSRFWIAFYLGT